MVKVLGYTLPVEADPGTWDQTTRPVDENISTSRWNFCCVSVNALRKWIGEEAFPIAKNPCWMTTTAKISDWVGRKVWVGA